MGVKGVAATPAPLVVPDAATSLSSNGFSASVIVSGVPAEVFASKSKANTHSGFIISRKGASFTVELDDLRIGATMAVAVDLFCDGEYMHGVAIGPGEPVLVFDGKIITAESIAPFHFSNISLSDDTSLCNEDPDLIKNLGTISLKLYRVVVGEPSPVDEVFVAAAPALKTINEKTKKGMMSEVTGLGDVIAATEEVAQQDLKLIDELDTPWITFTFKYRSRQLLELQSIIAEEEVPVKVEPKVVGKGKKRQSKKRQSNTIDESDEKFTMKKIKPEKRVKAEPGLKPEKGIKKEK